MEIRLGDLYELIVRIVDDRLKQRGETEHIAAMKGSESPSELQAKSPSEQQLQFQALQEQIATLIDLNRQILTAVRENQRRNEELLSELLNLLRQFLEASKIGDGRRTTLPSVEPSKPAGEREEAPKRTSERQRSGEKTRKPSELSELAVMSPPDLSDEEIAFTPPDNWLNETSPQPAATELAPDGVAAPTVNAQPSLVETMVERLPDYLRRLFGIDVDYLSARSNPIAFAARCSNFGGRRNLQRSACYPDRFRETAHHSDRHHHLLQRHRPPFERLSKRTCHERRFRRNF